MLKWLLFDHFPSQSKGTKCIATLFQCRGRCDSTRLIPFAAQPCHAPMFSDRAVEGHRVWFGVPGYRGRAPSGFWVLLGGPKVPPRRVLKTGNERRISTRIARNGRTTITSVLWTFSQPHLSLKRKVPLTVPKKLCGGPVPQHPPTATQGDCGPPGRSAKPPRTGDGSCLQCAKGHWVYSAA